MYGYLPIYVWVLTDTSYLYLIYNLSGCHNWRIAHIPIRECTEAASAALAAAAAASAAEAAEIFERNQNMWKQQQPLTPSPAVRRNVGAGGSTMGALR